MSQAAVIYCRVSSSGQQEGISFPVQLQRCRDLALSQGFNVIAELKETESGLVDNPSKY